MPNISIYLSIEEFKELLDLAEKNGVKPTKQARLLIAEGLKALGKQAKPHEKIGYRAV
jgi:hypothetical protein